MGERQRVQGPRERGQHARVEMQVRGHRGGEQHRADGRPEQDRERRRQPTDLLGPDQHPPQPHRRIAARGAELRGGRRRGTDEALGPQGADERPHALRVHVRAAAMAKLGDQGGRRRVALAQDLQEPRHGSRDRELPAGEAHQEPVLGEARVERPDVHAREQRVDRRVRFKIHRLAQVPSVRRHRLEIAMAPPPSRRGSAIASGS